MNPKTIEIANKILSVQHEEFVALSDMELELAFAQTVKFAITNPGMVPMSVILAHEIIRRQESAVTTVSE